MKKKLSILIALVMAISLCLTPAVAVATEPDVTIVVTPANVGVDWLTNDTRYGGYAEFVKGPGTPPLGGGSLEMGTTASQDKAQLFNYDYIGTKLTDIQDITYATYRDSSSTNSPDQYPSINMEVDYAGDGSSYATLVWEPTYVYDVNSLTEDTWETWDTMAASQTGFAGGWWSTADIPGIGAYTYNSWDTIVTACPNATIKYGFGVNVGSGWDGVFTGAVDALTITIGGKTTTYDFELASGKLTVTATSEDAVIGISVLPTSIDFGAITSGDTVKGVPLSVRNEGNVCMEVTTEITTDTLYSAEGYFYTDALKLNGEGSLTAPTLGMWRHTTLFGRDPIEVNGSRAVSTMLECPSLIKAGITYTGTVVFWAEQPVR